VAALLAFLIVPAAAFADGGAWTEADDPGSLASVSRCIGAQAAWLQSWTGQGVGVALIDSGVVNVPGLQGQVVYGPDLSFEGQDPGLASLDTFGHGTHLAGIIAGHDAGLPVTEEGAASGFLGIAPDARVISLKVATTDGSADVSQVLAAIDWVVQHRNDKDLNIRVLCLAYGTDSVQAPEIDPLAYAVDAAWKKGIVVVVSAGNSGERGVLNDPAVSPRVLSVGADDTRGTLSIDDDTVPAWSSRGDGQRDVDLLAPGKSIVSLRDPGGSVDVEHPEARVGERYFRGSGTSQSAAVVAGAAALVIQRKSDIKPDEVKALLMRTATPVPGTTRSEAGAGLVNLTAALAVTDKPRDCEQKWDPTGLGSLEAARGSNHLDDGGVELTGEVDIFGQTWNAKDWAHDARDGKGWKKDKTSLIWNGVDWMDASSEGVKDDAQAWASGSWTGRSWSGRSWSGRSWSGRSWSSDQWNGRSWSRRSWSGRSWSADNWSRRSWSTNGWGL
jgi:serine protease AprX